jgi:hypothetical protein
MQLLQYQLFTLEWAGLSHLTRENVRRLYEFFTKFDVFI